MLSDVNLVITINDKVIDELPMDKTIVDSSTSNDEITKEVIVERI